MARRPRAAAYPCNAIAAVVPSRRSEPIEANPPSGRAISRGRRLVTRNSVCTVLPTVAQPPRMLGRMDRFVHRDAPLLLPGLCADTCLVQGRVWLWLRVR